MEFLQHHDSTRLFNEQVVLFGRESIAERNATYEVNDYLPDYLAIGSDSGDRFLLVRRNASLTVYWADVGAFTQNSLEEVHANFDEWIRSDCPLLETSPDPEGDLPLCIDIYLMRSPDGGVKMLHELKQLLSLQQGLGELKRLLERLPACVMTGASAIVVKKRLALRPDLLTLLAYTERGKMIDFVHTTAGNTCRNTEKC